MLKNWVIASLLVLGLTPAPAHAGWFDFFNAPANKILAGPTGGGTGSAGWRSLVAADLPGTYVPTSTTVNGHALSSNVTVTNSDLGAVPTSTTVNGHALSSNVSVTFLDVTPSTQAISASAIDWSTGTVFTKTLGANTTFTFSNKASGQTIVVRLTNTASNYTVTWPTVKWAGGSAPTMTVGAHADVYTFVYDGTDIYGSAVQNF